MLSKEEFKALDERIQQYGKLKIAAKEAGDAKERAAEKLSNVTASLNINDIAEEERAAWAAEAAGTFNNSASKDIRRLTIKNLADPNK